MVVKDKENRRDHLTRYLGKLMRHGDCWGWKSSIMEKVKPMKTFVLGHAWMVVSLAEVRNTGKRLPRVKPSKLD